MHNFWSQTAILVFQVVLNTLISVSGYVWDISQTSYALLVIWINLMSQLS